MRASVLLFVLFTIGGFQMVESGTCVFVLNCRWIDYQALGKRIPGTRFITFKVPLQQVIRQERERERERELQTKQMLFG